VSGHDHDWEKEGSACVELLRELIRMPTINRGTGEGGERWIVDRYSLKHSMREDGKGGFLPLDPATYAEDWARLTDKVVTRRYPLADGSGRTMPVMRTMIDCGGADGVTERAYAYWRALKADGLHKHVRLIRGASSKDAPRFEERFPDVRGRKDRSAAKGDVPVVFVNTTTIKDAISGDLARTVPGPGFYHFPKWLGESFFRELTAEQRGKDRWENPGGARNEAFDLEVYNSAACLWLGADRIIWTNPPGWAAEWDKNPDLSETAAQPVARRPRVIRSNYMDRK
jgi:phage terminase large subunit GpA-like protein